MDTRDVVTSTRRTPDEPRRRSDEGLVPRYTIYGETFPPVVDFIEIEPIRDRSELFDWSIDAHTHAGLLQVVLLFGGSVRVTLDEMRHDLVAPAVISIPSSVIHSFEFEPDSSGYVVTLADGQLDSTAMGPWVRAQLLQRGLTLPLDADDPLGRRLGVLCGELLHEQKTVETGRVATMDWLSQTVLVLLARQSERLDDSSSGHLPSDLFREFHGAIEDHYVEHWPVRRYADHLHVSESSLNRLCRAVAGATAFEIIQDRLELEARRRLTYTTVPIHRLANDLGFVDPSYFSRFFRRRTGSSPRTFRRERLPAPMPDTSDS